MAARPPHKNRPPDRFPRHLLADTTVGSAGAAARLPGTQVSLQEARAITWDEIDPKAGTVAVYRSVRVKGDTKRRKGRRVLKLPIRAVQALRAHHTRQPAERLAAGEMWQEHDLVFCRGDGTPLDRWHVRKEFQKITRAARLGGAWTPREPRHPFVSILSAHDVRLEGISDLVGQSSTSVTETVYRHEIRRALTASAMNRTLKANATEPGCPRSGKAIGSPIGSRNLSRKTHLTSRDGGI